MKKIPLLADVCVVVIGDNADMDLSDCFTTEQGKAIYGAAKIKRQMDIISEMVRNTENTDIYFQELEGLEKIYLEQLRAIEVKFND